MKLSDFDFNLPKELIAQYPLKERDSARLIIVERKNGKISHANFSEITNFFAKEDLLVLNDTKVLACRLLGRRKTGGKVDILLLNKKSSTSFSCLVKPARIKSGETISFNHGSIEGRLISRDEISFSTPDADKIYASGVMPLPPYIKRPAEALDNIYYQTEYARNAGAIAAPTAGLHFTRKLLEDIKASGVNLAYLTLHVGVGTFKPVKVDDITNHKMSAEYFQIPEDTLRNIKKARSQNKRIFAVGTTSLRALETYAQGKKEGDTDLFIYPGYKFKLADCLLTNFHLPRTTLFMLVCAFCAAGSAEGGSAYGRASGRDNSGLELAKAAYKEAIDKKYRFYSYGDAMLII